MDTCFGRNKLETCEFLFSPSLSSLIPLPLFYTPPLPPEPYFPKKIPTTKLSERNTDTIFSFFFLTQICIFLKSWVHTFITVLLFVSALIHLILSFRLLLPLEVIVVEIVVRLVPALLVAGGQAVHRLLALTFLQMANSKLYVIASILCSDNFFYSFHSCSVCLMANNTCKWKVSTT